MAFDLEARLKERAEAEHWSKKRIDEFRDTFNQVFEYAEKTHWWEDKSPVVLEDSGEFPAPQNTVKGSKEEEGE